MKHQKIEKNKPINDIKVGDFYYFGYLESNIDVKPKKRIIFVLSVDQEMDTFETLSNDPYFKPLNGWSLDVANFMWRLEKYEKDK